MKTEVPGSISEPGAVATGSRPGLIKCFLTLDPVATAPGSDTDYVVGTQFRT